MIPDDPTRTTERESVEFFRELFPQGLGGDDLLAELAPAGWENSPLINVYHPTPEILFEESQRMHENLQSLSKRLGKKKVAKEETPVEPPTLEEIRAEHKPTPIDPTTELRELIGRCLWDVFADNHEVIASDGRIVDLGSFRAAGGFLADLVNEEIGAPKFDDEAFMKKMIADSQEFQKDPTGASFLQKIMEEAQQPREGYNYMDFYMGTSSIGARADLSPVYRLIFRRLQSRDANWVYHFPQLHLVDLRPLHDQMKENDPDSPAEWESYDPAASFAEEQERKEKDAEIAETRAKMAESHREAVEEAAQGPSPTTVQCYRAVYGKLPEGWPPTVEEP